MRPAARTSWSAPTSSSRSRSRRVRTSPPASGGTGPAAPAGADPIPVSPIPAVNVASVPQRSPLRYPGGKTWLIPHIRHWLKGIEPRPKLLVEPFAGGGIVSLTAVMEGLVDRCLMVELDRDVAAFWHAALRHGPELCEMVQHFQPTREAVDALSRQAPATALEHGFRTLVLNRTRRGGILAPGASLIRSGECGMGLASRWYPGTLVRRLLTIADYAHRIEFNESDGMALLEATPAGAVLFVDPPYSAGGKRAGQRLYLHNQLDHARLFALLADTAADFLLTYDGSDEIRKLVRKHGFRAVRIEMRNTHHARISELAISRRPVF
ncbi:MAG: DNA adenine methylase [Alphaproteobacteria bacterium]|nr:DNA adenine methylase [Alphaproteobacteria bacterium]